MCDTDPSANPPVVYRRIPPWWLLTKNPSKFKRRETKDDFNKLCRQSDQRNDFTPPLMGEPHVTWKV